VSEYEDQVRPDEDDTEGHGFGSGDNVNETVEEDDAVEDDTEAHMLSCGGPNVNETVDEDEAVEEGDGANK
jgi:hypothetical protein